MLFINWYQINWMAYMPIFIGLFLIVILFLRILRKLTRWAPIGVSHVAVGIIEFQNEQFILYHHQNPKSDNDSDLPPQLNPNYIPNPNSIFLISPLTVQRRDQYPLAVSIAITGRDVILPAKDQFFSWNDVTHQKFPSFLDHFNISSIIAFDYAIPFMFQLFSQLDDRNITWCFIRPTFQWTNVRLWYQLWPFSAVGLTILALRTICESKKTETDETGRDFSINSLKSVQYLFHRTRCIMAY